MSNLMFTFLITVGWVLWASSAGEAQSQLESLSPATGTARVAEDATLKITFTQPVVLGKSGTIRIVNSTDQVDVETIDLTRAVVPSPEAPATTPATTPATSSATPPAKAPARPGPAFLADDISAPEKIKNVGGVKFKYYPVIVSTKQAEIALNTPLALGKTYTVYIDPGVFCSPDTHQPIAIENLAWTFTTRDTVPTPQNGRIVVAADGSGDFQTVQGALDSIPDKNSAPVTVFVKKGIYTELIYLSGKNAVTILGEDRKQTVIEYANNAVFNLQGPGGYRRGVLRVNKCDDFVLANLTVRNSTARGGSQAEAIIFNNSVNARAIVANVDLYSFQDTLQINGQAYITNTYIEGDVDFMWGDGPCFFDKCVARTVRSGAFYTQIRNPATNHGFVYYQCTLDGLTGINRNMLSRIDPGRFTDSEVVFIDCTMTQAVGPGAWRFDKTTDANNVHFWEFNSHTPDGQPVDVSQRAPFSKQLSKETDAETIKNYSDPAWVLGGWNPRQAKLPEMPITQAMRPAGDQPTQFER